MTDNSGNENERDINLITSRIKIFYWIMALIFSAVFLYLAGVDFHELNLHNKRVEAVVFGLICGIFLIYFNIFHTGYKFSEKLISSFVYLFCLSMMAYIYKPLLYDASSYERVSIALRSGKAERETAHIIIAVLMIIFFVLFIMHNDD